MSSALSQTLDAVPLETVPHAERSLFGAYDRNARGLYRFFQVRVGRDRNLADDLMQQLWVACREAPSSTASNTSAEPIAWLFAVARNLVAAHWRKHSSRPAHIPIADPCIAAELAARLADDHLPDDLLQKKEVHDQLLLALTTLDGEAQDLIVDHYFHGFSHDALAGRLGIGVRAVEGRLYRARRLLRERLSRLDPQET